MSKSPPSSPSQGTAGVRHKHIQTFFDTTRGQVTIGEIPPIRCAALAAVGKKVHVALVCQSNETVDQLLTRLDAALGTVLASGTPLDEVLPEIKRLRR
jgi:hypothetical protein